jgi:RNA polymerase sigma factor (sigma-70 family)
MLSGASEQATIQNIDRIKNAVKTFKFSAGGKALPDFEWGSAASEAYLRVIAMGADFREREPGQFYAALVRCVHNSCRDFGRKEFRHTRRAGGSLDQRFDPEGEHGPYDGALAAYDASLREQSKDAVHEELARQDAEQLVGWATTQIRNDKHREVLELTFSKNLDTDQIAERLAITPQNVYKRRSRGMQELEQILRGS